VPLDPQPDEDTVVTLVRYYATSAASNDYKRCVTYVMSSKFAAGLSDRFVVEYFGEHVQGSAHGNARNPSAPPYIRTPAATMDEIIEKLQRDGASAVYNDVRVKDDIADR